MFLLRDDRKISVIGGLLLLGLTLTTGLAVYYTMRQQVESALGRGLSVALQGKALLLESQVEKALADTRALTHRPFWNKALQRLNIAPNDTEPLEGLQRSTESLFQSGFLGVTLHSANGTLLTQAGHFSINKEQSLTLNRGNKTFLFWDKQFILHTSQDIFDPKNQHIATVTVEIVIPKLTRRFSEIRLVGETGEFILCAPPNQGEGDNEMPCLVSQADGVKFKRLKHTAATKVQPISFALEGKNGVVAAKDYRDIPVIEAYHPLQTIGLGMVLKLDESELFKPINKELKIIILYLVGLIIAEILLLNWFVGRLITSEQKARSAKEIAEKFSTELSYKENQLQERLKEITCLYEIRSNINLELPVHDLCQRIFRYLVPALQYPDNVSATIELDGKQIASSNNAKNLIQELNSAIIINGKTCGQLRVFYPEDKKFLVEEQKLIDAITTDFSRWLERKQVDELLHIRLREITCLYKIRRGLAHNLSIESVCQNIFEFLIPAIQFPEITTVIIEIYGKRFNSKNYRLSFDSKSLAVLPDYEKVCLECYRESDVIGSSLQSKIIVDNEFCGYLSVLYPDNQPYLVLEEQNLIDAIASDLSNWLERKKVDELLNERLKEMTCLYEIRRGIGAESLIDNVCQTIFTHLIRALQFPEIATAVIELNGWRFTSGKYDPNTGQRFFSKIKPVVQESRPRRAERDPACTCWSTISVNGKVCGQLRVFYPIDKPLLLPEEQKMINAIASDLESWLERKRLEQALVLVAEEQAHTLGQELHDNIGQQVAAISYQTRALEKQIAAIGDDNMSVTAASIASQAQTAVIQIKQLAQGLLPFELEANGLIPALRTLASRITTTYKIVCDFTCKGNIMIDDNILSLNLYRIAQEAANNAIRHGQAQHLYISLVLDGDMLRLSIRDDGVGLGDSPKSTSGMGIKIMQYRAKQLGAKFEILQPNERGIEIRLEMQMT
ncbi:hypothetical protein W03_00900 [Nitrosomonas sp. PY1]|nr:hypothetical protein W03_00900 [Nitrosomonas sp. PY1]